LPIASDFAENSPISNLSKASVKFFLTATTESFSITANGLPNVILSAISVSLAN